MRDLLNNIPLRKIIHYTNINIRSGVQTRYASLALGVSFLVLKALTTALGFAEEAEDLAFCSGSSDSPSDDDDDDADEAEGFPES